MILLSSSVVITTATNAAAAVPPWLALPRMLVRRVVLRWWGCLALLLLLLCLHGHRCDSFSPTNSVIHGLIGPSSSSTAPPPLFRTSSWRGWPSRRRTATSRTTTSQQAPYFIATTRQSVSLLILLQSSTASSSSSSSNSPSSSFGNGRLVGASTKDLPHQISPSQDGLDDLDYDDSLTTEWSEYGSVTTDWEDADGVYEPERSTIPQTLSDTNTISIIRNESRLEDVTNHLLDVQHYPLGELTEDDVETMGGVMAAWAKRGAPHQVEQLLKRIVDDVRANPHSMARVRTSHYVHAMLAWSRSGVKGAAFRVQQIHDNMVQTYRRTSDTLLAPTVVSYQVLLRTWAKSREEVAVQYAEQILQEMVQQVVQHGNEQCQPNEFTLTAILEIYSRSFSTSTSVSNRTAIIARCEALIQLADQLNITRTSYSYSALQSVYARSGMPYAVQKVQSILQEMENLYHQGHIHCKPDRVNYQLILQALSRIPIGTVGSARMACDLLNRMERSVEEGGIGIPPDRLGYIMTIVSCARCHDRQVAAQWAVRTLEQMEQRALEEEKRRAELSSVAPPRVTLDLGCFNTALAAVARSRSPDAYRQAMRIIQRMEQYAAEGKEELRPVTRSWNGVLKAIARTAQCSRLDSAALAERIMDRILSTPNKPNRFTFAAMLSCYQHSPYSRVERADALVRRMEELYERGELEHPPGVVHMTILCKTWARSRHPRAAARCLEILGDMMVRHQAGIPDINPNIHTYNAVLECLYRSNQATAEQAEELLYHMLRRFANGDVDAKPCKYSFNIVIGAFCRAELKDAGKRAETILERFVEFQEECPDVCPDTRSFLQIIRLYARNKELDDPYRAEHMLHRLVAAYQDGQAYVIPNSVAFTIVMDSYSYAKHPDAGRNAERLLKLMRKLRDEHPELKDIIINAEVTNSVLLAWASCGDEDAGLWVEQHLDEMERQCEAGQSNLCPDTKSYVLAITAWAKSRCVDKAERALSILRRMQVQAHHGRDRVVLSERAYSLVINSCAFTSVSNSSSYEDAAKVFHIAITVFDELLASEDTISLVPLPFGWFLLACGRLPVPHDVKNPHLVRAFQECCTRGLLTDGVLARFKQAAPMELWENLVVSHVSSSKPHNSTMPPQRSRDKNVSVLDLPPSWSCHAILPNPKSREFTKDKSWLGLNPPKGRVSR